MRVKGPGTHVWVYRDKVLDAAEPGEAVEVYTRRGRFVGCGLFNPQSKIAIRIYSRRREDLDYHGIKERLYWARERRRRLGLLGDAYRLAYGESDWLPGLVVDVYGDTVVFQINSLGMELRRDAVVEAIDDLLSPRVIYEKSTTSNRRKEGLPDREEVFKGDVEPVRVEVGGLFMWADPRMAKTGLYLDQRLNWREVASLVREGDRVLDLFSYTGGFGLWALRRGAEVVYLVDSSARALEVAEANRELNGLGGRLVTLRAEARRALGELASARERFNLIVVDPPSLAKTREELPKAMDYLAELLYLCLGILEDGGVLVVFSCSNHMKREHLFQVAARALSKAQRDMIVLRELGQAPDHPVPPGFPEAQYLWGLVLVEA